MTLTRVLTVGAMLALPVLASPVLAQTAASPAPATQPAPAAQPAAKPDRKAVSQACSAQANAKGLHGKARKSFRSACKHNAGATG